MGRLKKDHSGWRTSGLWLKYQQPKINESESAHKSKKNKTRWCKGRVGSEHEYELVIPNNDPASIRGFRKMPVCKKCGKQDYRGVLYRSKKTGEYEKGIFPWD